MKQLYSSHEKVFKRVGWISSFLLHFTLFGFPIQSFIPYLLNVDSNPINFIFRIIFLAIALGLLVFTILVREGELSKSNKGWIWFLCFWIVYSARLIYDLEVQGLTYLETDAFYVYSFAFGVTLIPSIAVYKTASFISHRQSVNLCITLLFISNLCLFYSILSSRAWNLMEVLLLRGEVTVEIQGETQSIVNPITVSYFGALLAVLALVRLLFSTERSKSIKTFEIVCLAIGVSNLIIGASRGPLITFFVLLFYVLYSYYGSSKRIGYVAFASIILIVSFLGSIQDYLLTVPANSPLAVVSRFSGLYSSGRVIEKEERQYEWQSAIEQFLDRPVLGDAFVTRYDKSYSHNLFLDVFMSTGVIGAMLFSLMFFWLFKKLRALHNQRPPNLHLRIFLVLWLGAFLSNMFSGGLFVAANFWMLTAFILSLNFYDNENSEC